MAETSMPGLLIVVWVQIASVSKKKGAPGPRGVRGVGPTAVECQ